MGTDCTTAPPAASPAAGPPRVAVRLRVGVRHAATSLCVRVACLNALAVPAQAPSAQATARSMAEVLAAADRLLREAGSHRGRIVSCDLFVHEPAHAADARHLLGSWMAGGATTRPQVEAPAVRAHSLPRLAPGGTPNTAEQALVDMVLVVAHRAGTGTTTLL